MKSIFTRLNPEQKGGKLVSNFDGNLDIKRHRRIIIDVEITYWIFKRQLKTPSQKISDRILKIKAIRQCRI